MDLLDQAGPRGGQFLNQKLLARNWLSEFPIFSFGKGANKYKNLAPYVPF
jgi:hypothetical protein